MKLSSPPESNLTDRVAATLREQITQGGFSPGDVLPPETVIAGRLGISRTVLREAVSRLKADGLVSSKQGVGLVVLDNRPSSVLRLRAAAAHDLEEVISIVELRLGFEIEAAGFAAMRRDADDLEEMRQALAEMRAAVESGKESIGVEADFRFHRAIANATRNPNYITFFGFLAQLYRHNLVVSRERSAKMAPRGRLAQQEHEAIFEAILAGDADAARRAARVHVENTGKRLRSAGELLAPVKRIKHQGSAVKPSLTVKPVRSRRTPLRMPAASDPADITDSRSLG